LIVIAEQVSQKQKSRLKVGFFAVVAS